MATVKTRTFSYTAKSGEKMEFKAPVTVDRDGEFTINIPDELSVAADQTLRLPIWNKSQVSLNKARVNLRVQGKFLHELERFIEESLKEHLSVEVKEELVIRYRYLNHTSAVIGNGEEVHPNGQWVDTSKPWSWEGNKSLHATNSPHFFSVGVVAKVYKKITYTRPNGSKVEYNSELPGSHHDHNPMRRLNGFMVRSPDQAQSNIGGVMRSSQSESEALHEMPYSDAAADFFSDLMLTMFRLGLQMENFIGNQENLLLAIERGAGLLSAPSGPKMISEK